MDGERIFDNVSSALESGASSHVAIRRDDLENLLKYAKTLSFVAGVAEMQAIRLKDVAELNTNPNFHSLLSVFINLDQYRDVAEGGE